MKIIEAVGASEVTFHVLKFFHRSWYVWHCQDSCSVPRRFLQKEPLHNTENDGRRGPSHPIATVPESLTEPPAITCVDCELLGELSSSEKEVFDSI